MVLFLCFVGAGVGGMTKRGGASYVEIKDPKKPKSGEDVSPSSTALPFGQQTDLRTFKLHIGDRSLYVNAHVLAEFSPYFYNLCLGPFTEGITGEATLNDTNYEDFVEMLMVMGTDFQGDQTEIAISNFISMLKLSEKWQIEGLRTRCITFIKSRFPSVPTNFATTVQVLMACEECRVPEAIVGTVGSRLAAFGRSLLVAHEVFSNIQNMRLWSAVLAAAETSEMDLLHNNYISTTKECNVPDCKLMVPTCSYCQFAGCSLHNICIKRVGSFKTTTNKQLDENVLKRWRIEKVY